MRTPRAFALRRAATLLLSLVMAMSLCPAAALADAGDAVGSLELAASSGDDIASGTLGTCTWVIDSEGCLTIAPANGTSGSFEFADAGYDTWPWHEYCDDISVVAVESGVKASGSLACMFCGCSSLVSADLSGLDTSIVDNMYQMFYACESLTSLDLSSFDTSNVTDMFWMFGSCYSLVSLDLSSFDTSNITYMGGMFQACNSLTSLDLSSFDTSNVTSMSDMFYYCYSLTSLDLSSFDTAGVTDMYSMFSGCSSLIFLDLSSFDTSNVTNMAFMFFDCSSLIFLDLSSFDTSNVEDAYCEGVYGMLASCSSLEILDESGFAAGICSSLNDYMEGMFYGCTALRQVVLGDGFSFVETLYDDCGPYLSSPYSSAYGIGKR